MTYSGNRILLFILAVLFLVSNNEFSQSRKFYVGTNGSDSDSGLSIDHSLLTINRAVEKAASGDSIFVLPGTYRELISISSKQGEPENPICITGYSSNKNDYPVIDGAAVKPAMELTNDWISLNNSSWIEFGKMKFVNGWTYPIKVNNSSYISFINCIFIGGRRVISGNGPSTHHLLIEKCFWDQGGEFLWTVVEDDMGVDAWTSMHHGEMMYYNGSIIDFSGTGGSVVIRNNKIINAFNAIRWRGVKGFDSNVEIYNNDISSIRDNDFEPESYTYNLHIYHNISHNIHRTASIDNVDGGNIYYYGNVITTDDNEWTRKVCTGFWKVYGSHGNLSFPMYAFNNSFYGVAKALRAEQDLIRFKHFNNAYFFTGDTAWYLNKFAATDEFDYDISNRDWPAVFSQNGQEKHGRIGDVMFVAPAAKNLKLKNGSPAIDAGRIMKFPEFNWTQKFKGHAPDIGAYEYNELVEGPPFRFMAPPDGTIKYKEKPRIVRDKIDGNKLIIHLSSQVNPSSVSKGMISVYNGSEKLAVKSVSESKNNYSLTVELKSMPKAGNISISFDKLPVGLNGEVMTSWASTIKIHKKN